MVKHFSTYIEWHLGDNIYHLDYLRKLINNNPEFIFSHYCKKQYINELSNHITEYENNIQLYPIEYGVPEKAINVWIGANNWYYDYKKNNLSSPLMYDIMYIDWYNHLQNIYGLPNPIQTVEDFLLTFPKIDIYDLPKQYDVLVINSTPQSSQYHYEEDLFKKLIYNFINQGHNIITTKKIDNIECTLDYNYNLTQIAKISTKTPIIIAIHTGPIVLCLNKITLNNSQFFHILDNEHSYSFDKITSSSTLNLISF